MYMYVSLVELQKRKNNLMLSASILTWHSEEEIATSSSNL